MNKMGEGGWEDLNVFLENVSFTLDTAIFYFEHTHSYCPAHM